VAPRRIGKMGNACATSIEDQRSKQIELQIQQDRKEQSKETKLLLLGAGESGKSTVLKQMKIIHCKGFSQAERERHKEIVFSNIILSMNTLIQCLGRTGRLSQLSPECQKYAQLFLYGSSYSEQELTKEISDGVKLLWSQDLVKRLFATDKELQIPDSVSFFFDEIDRISQQDFIPTEQDVLRARVRTTGITEVSFSILENKFRVVDVGGQRSERKKWIHCFQNVTALIFCVAMSEYDLTLFEDSSVNRMQESMELFSEIVNCEWFAQSAIILFLNKSDLFQEKIQRVDLNVCFPEYTGGLDFKAGCAFLKDKFNSLNRDKSRTVYAHVTCATDTQNIRFVFSAVKEILLQSEITKFVL